MHWTSGEWIGYNIEDGSGRISGLIILTVFLIAGIGYLSLLYGSRKTVSRLKDEEDIEQEVEGEKYEK